MRDKGAQAGLRIGLFAHRLAGRHPTGIGRYFRELVCALDAVTGDQKLVVSSTREVQDAAWIPSGVQKTVVRWPRRPVQLAWSLGAGPRLERSLGPLSVAHLLQPFPPVRTRAPQLVTVHDLFPIEHPSWYSSSERWTFRVSIELLIRRRVTVVVPSQYVAERVGSSLDVEPSRVRVVPLGVSGTFSDGGSAGDIARVCRRFDVSPDRFAVCLGTVSTRKNVIALVRAMAKLAGSGLPLVMIGPDGHGAREVDAEIARLDGRCRVVRTGFLPDADTAALVQAATVLLHPALGEGFGLVPLEAMAVGTPVIASRISSVPEVVGPAAVLVDEPTEPAGWAQAMADLLGDEDRRSALARAGAERARQFSWAETARRMVDLYRELARA
jgi:glycosyltransferase involved in cell wall biosynthesis